ncbi:hypothetical protein [Chryseobacterium carnipullorum]|uniref:hypothetical protein n=1 Tax=Chryseobacterium carnipullorum TaxID=1124835 RepID=UPI000E9684B4|nr:hypothetical protein [Chryseobacterium carnipullorum]HBV14953.1 hypothetical protein [Chryseobacterium carnipullorum]
MEDTINQRFKIVVNDYIKGELGIKNVELANFLGIKPALFSEILNFRTNLSLETAAKFLSMYPQVNTQWLLTGTGSMLNGPVKNNESLFFSKERKNLFEKFVKFFEEVDNSVNNEYQNIQTEDIAYTFYRREHIMQDVLFLWDWIDSMYSNIINISILVDQNTKDDILNKYSFMSNMRNKYYDEKILYKTGNRPFTEREYSDSLIDVRSLSINLLVSYKNDLQQSFDTFQDIFNSSMKQLKK